MSGRRPSGGHRYPRSARLNETLREVIAEELVKIDDERLSFVTITAVDVDNELNRAVVFFDSLADEDADAAILDALERHRRRMQSSINRQIKAKKTPILQFRPDDVIRSAERIEDILRADANVPAAPEPWAAAGRRPSTGWPSSTSRPGSPATTSSGMLRRRFGERRIGHAGTLDPSATGVLVVGVGNVTRLLRFAGDGRKRYVGEVVLGVETDTLDADGTVTAHHDMAAVTLDEARQAVADHLIGEIVQVPPMVSALRVEGRRLHELAREGIEVERAPRPVSIDRFDVALASAAGDAPVVLAIDVECSGGTYVRTLAADLGRLLGGGGHLRHLGGSPSARTRSTRPRPLTECTLLRPTEAVRAMTARRRRRGDRRPASRDGRVLPAPDRARARGRCSTPTATLLAVYEPFGDGQAKPAVVLPPPTGDPPSV